MCDDADGNRTVFLRTAAMGKSMFTAKVEAVVPKLDIAILSITRGGEHEKWFLPESPELYLGGAQTSDALSKTHLKQNAQNKHPRLPTGAGESTEFGLACREGHRRRGILQLICRLILVIAEALLRCKGQYHWRLHRYAWRFGANLICRPFLLRNSIFPELL